MKKYVAVDYETFYSDEYSLTKMSTWSYVYDKRFDAYMVSITDGGETKYVGHPKDFNWDKLEDCTLVAHNAGFDGLVSRRLAEDGMLPKFMKTIDWVDTADLAAYLRCKRDLASAAKHLLERPLNKSTRSKMKGMTLAQAEAAGMGTELREYASADAVASLELWHKLSHLWPESERRLSKLHREACWRGVRVNTEALDHALRGRGKKVFPGWSTDDTFVGIDHQTFDALNAIPWVTDGEKPLSVHALRAEARKCGMTGVPTSFGEKNKDGSENLELLDFEARYAEQFPWVRATRDFRRLNTLAKKLHNLEQGLHDGVFSYQSKYWGAATGRLSAGSGKGDDDTGGKFNLYNLYRKPVFGVDVRRLLIPRPGRKFYIADYAQVEARALLWRVGDTQFVDLINREKNLYQAYAKQRGLYKGSNLKKDDANIYQAVKVEVLGCGYQCGWSKFQNVAKAQYGLVLSDQQAKQGVSAYRETFPLVPEHWYRHQNALRQSVKNKDATHEVELASGRSLIYYNPAFKSGHCRGGEPADMCAVSTLGTPPKKLYGGKLTENEIQATCRDLLRDAWLLADDRGFEVDFTVYDELVYDVPDDVSEKEASNEIHELMTTCSPWMAGCPLDTEIHVLNYYTK